MDTEWTGQDSETSAPSPVLGMAGLLVRQKEAGGVSKEAAGFGEEVYTVLTPESRGRGEKAAFLLFVYITCRLFFTFFFPTCLKYRHSAAGLGNV